MESFDVGKMADDRWLAYQCHVCSEGDAVLYMLLWLNYALHGVKE